jgi:hypothetical protein
MKATAEQRAAVALIQSEHPATIEQAVKVMEAISSLAKGWAAEHPDDDDDDASWEWLRDVMGWEVLNSGALRTPAGAREMLAWRDSQGEVSIGVWSQGTRIPFLFSPKRRQVRLLVESLGAGE